MVIIVFIAITAVSFLDYLYILYWAVTQAGGGHWPGAEIVSPPTAHSFSSVPHEACVMKRGRQTDDGFGLVQEVEESRPTQRHGSNNKWRDDSINKEEQSKKWHWGAEMEGNQQSKGSECKELTEKAARSSSAWSPMLWCMSDELGVRVMSDYGKQSRRGTTWLLWPWFGQRTRE